MRESPCVEELKLTKFAFYTTLIAVYELVRLPEKLIFTGQSIPQFWHQFYVGLFDTR